MKKLKIIVIILYVAFVVEILGAWSGASEAQETMAYAQTMDSRMVVEENLAEAQELAAKEEYAKIRTEERERSNEYYEVINATQEEKNDRRLEKEQKRKDRIRKRKREERKILERIVEAEAGDQDLKGRVLVANVIMNRVKSKHFPSSVKSVVFAHRQFSPVQNGSYYRVHVSEKTKKAVEKALDGKDYSEGALYFMCRSASSPSNVAWFDRALTKVKEYGCHEFFK